MVAIKPNTPADVLSAAIAWYGPNGERWHQGSLFTHKGSVHFDNREKACLMGVTELMRRTLGVGWRIVIDADNYIKSALPFPFVETVTFNDMHKQRWCEVLATLQIALKYARENRPIETSA